MSTNDLTHCTLLNGAQHAAPLQMQGLKLFLCMNAWGAQ